MISMDCTKESDQHNNGSKFHIRHWDGSRFASHGANIQVCKITLVNFDREEESIGRTMMAEAATIHASDDGSLSETTESLQKLFNYLTDSVLCCGASHYRNKDGISLEDVFEGAILLFNAVSEWDELTTAINNRAQQLGAAFESGQFGASCIDKSLDRLECEMDPHCMWASPYGCTSSDAEWHALFDEAQDLEDRSNAVLRW